MPKERHEQSITHGRERTAVGANDADIACLPAARHWRALSEPSSRRWCNCAAPAPVALALQPLEREAMSQDHERAPLFHRTR